MQTYLSYNRLLHLSTALDPSTALDDVHSKAQLGLRSHPLYNQGTARTANNQSMCIIAMWSLGVRDVSPSSSGSMWRTTCLFPMFF